MQQSVTCQSLSMSLDVLFASLCKEREGSEKSEVFTWEKTLMWDFDVTWEKAPPKPAARPPLTAIGFLHRNNCSFATQKCERCQKRFSQCSRIWGDTRITLTWRTIDQYVEPAAVDHCQSGFLRAATIATLQLRPKISVLQKHHLETLHNPVLEPVTNSL